MATPKRIHRTVGPWGAEAEKIAWVRSRPGKPRRGRLDRPLLTHESGWDWDGARILSSKKSHIPDSDKEWTYDSEERIQDDAHYPIPLGRAGATLSLLDIAQHQVMRRHNKAWSGLDDFEVIRIPNVVPISEDDPDPGNSWGLSEWEKLDALSFRRTYSEAVRGFVVARDPLNTPGCSRLASNYTGDEPWECL